MLKIGGIKNEFSFITITLLVACCQWPSRGHPASAGRSRSLERLNPVAIEGEFCDYALKPWHVRNTKTVCCSIVG